MIAYVESNFLLEIALGQEQEDAASSILRLAEDQLISLAIPSFALSEPFSTVVHRHAHRMERIGELQKELVQLRRSVSRRDEVAALGELLSQMTNVATEEVGSLKAVVSRVLEHARIIDTTRATFQAALTIEREYSLTIQDAIILAAVQSDLAAQSVNEPKCFVSANFKDFSDPGIRQALRAGGCRYIGSFSAAYDFLLSALRGADDDRRVGEDE